MARGKRVEIVKIIVDGAEVDAKACTKCCEVKALTCFNKHAACPDGSQPYCRECQKRVARERTEQSARSSGKIARVLTKRTAESYKKEVNALTEGEYMVVGSYCGSKKGVEMLHTACGRTWLSRPNSFISGGQRCPHCYGNSRKSTDQFKEEVHKAVGDEYCVLGNYVNSKTRLLIQHTLCNHAYLVTPNMFLRGKRCPRCEESHGERAIRNYLFETGLLFKEQGTYEGCRHKRVLPFDFIVYTNKGDVAIEYDGEHHSMPVDFAGRGEEWARQKFGEVKRNDRIKTDYCLANGIPLIRIDYTEFDRIEEILTQRLAELGVTGKRLNGVIAQDSSETSSNNVKSIAEEDAA